ICSSVGSRSSGAAVGGLGFWAALFFRGAGFFSFAGVNLPLVLILPALSDDLASAADSLPIPLFFFATIKFLPNYALPREVEFQAVFRSEPDWRFPGIIPHLRPLPRERERRTECHASLCLCKAYRIIITFGYEAFRFSLVCHGVRRVCGGADRGNRLHRDRVPARRVAASGNQQRGCSPHPLVPDYSVYSGGPGPLSFCHQPADTEIRERALGVFPRARFL